MPVSVALTNARIHTLDQEETVAEAIALEGTRIAAVGSNSQVLSHAGPSARVVDLGGRTVLPGFIDAHTHWEVTSYVQHQWIDATQNTPDEVLDVIRDEVTRRAPGDWIIVAGHFLSEFPSLDALDSIAPQHPVVVRRTMHEQVANSKAFELSALTAADMHPSAQSRLQVDDSGHLTGLIEDAFDRLSWPRASDDQLDEALVATARDLFVSNGITTIHDMPASRHGMRAMQRLRSTGSLPLRVVMYPILPPIHSTGPDLDTFTSVSLQSGFGDDWLKFGGLKLFVDGHGHGAAHGHDIASDDPNRYRQGLFGRTYEDLVRLVTTGMEHGIQLRMHAWGDYAQRQALDAIRTAIRATGTYNHRTRIEHMLNAAYPDIPYKEIIELGIIPVPQASFMVNDDPTPGTIKYPFRSAHDAGLRFANSSDITGSQPTMVNPWVGIAAMTGRTNRNGDLLDLEEAVTLTEALRSYTTDAAYAAFEEADKGSLEVGKLADLSIVDADPYELEPHELTGISTQATIIDGRTAWARDESLSLGSQLSD